MRARALFAGVVAFAAAGGGALWILQRGVTPTPLPTGGVPVIVELFSAEGCRSCPPADSWLAALDRAQSIGGVAVIALEEHVDYWDDLGWRDPFGQHQFSVRQGAYARVLSDKRTYTPEIVIDGTSVVEGGDEEQAARAMVSSTEGPHARVEVVRDGDSVTIDVTNIPRAESEQAEVWFAVTESGLTTDVSKGENAGHTLRHAPVVRALRKLGVAEGGSFHADTKIDASLLWARRSLRAVAFVQESESRRIIGANAE